MLKIIFSSIMVILKADKVFYKIMHGITAVLAAVVIIGLIIMVVYNVW